VTADLVLLSRVSFRGREIAGPRLRGLIALLAADLRTGCGVGRLVEGLWPDEQPGNPPKALQILVSRARAQLGADVIVRTPTGYRLALTEDRVDSSAVLIRAAATARCSTAGDHAAALAHADAGLALWGGAGPGPAGDTGDPVAALRAERRATYRILVRARALALARLDQPTEAVDRLAEVAAAACHPSTPPRVSGPPRRGRTARAGPPLGAAPRPGPGGADPPSTAGSPRR
jgi:DNA-binding SARP family transcriptional activator